MTKPPKRPFPSYQMRRPKRVPFLGKGPALSPRPDILKNLIGFAATGLLGAAASYGVTLFNRLPSRALSILPAGIHIIEGPVLNCDDSQFITGTVNTYIDSEVTAPPCNVLLSRPQVSNLRHALGIASEAYETERISPFKAAKRRIDLLAAAPPPSEQQLKTAVLASIGDLEYIHENAPTNLPAKALLMWTRARIDRVLTTINAENDRIGSIIKSLQVGNSGIENIELFFVADNSSDVELYVSTACEVQQGDRSVQIVVQKVGNDDALSSSLVFLPILPGRGRLLKYTALDQGQLKCMICSTRSLRLVCRLASGKQYYAPPFSPGSFIARESTFSSQ